MRVSLGTRTGTKIKDDGRWASVRFDDRQEATEIIRTDKLTVLPSGFTNADVSAEVLRRFPDVASFSPDLRIALAEDVKKEWYTALPCGHTVYDHVKEFGPQMTELMQTVPLTLIALVMGELDNPTPEFKIGERVIYRHKGRNVFARIAELKDDQEYVIRLRDGGEYLNVAVHVSDLTDAPLSDEEKYGR